jgi:uncharacterized protein
MKWIYIPVAAGLLLMYTALNYYIGLRGAQAFAILLSPRGLRVGWILFWAAVYLYPAARLLQRWIPSPLDRWLIHAGSYWMAVMVYMLMIVIILDVGRLLLGAATVNVSVPTWVKPVAGVLVLSTVFVLLVYGTWNARNPRVVHYQVHLSPGNESVAKGRTIQTAMVSDIHLGTIIRNNRLEKLVRELSELNPDLILFVGDIIDENVNHFIDEQMDKTLGELNPPLGMYAVLGNHEYYGGHLEEIVLHLEQAGIKVLRDEAHMIADSFYLAGREDLASEQMLRKPRKSLNEVLAGIDPHRVPVVLMDHQPKTWTEARDAGVRLQVSGHTHRGQLFPFGWITQRLFDEDWGKLEQDGGTLIVSSGYGTWGPPIRTGNRPEIVMITLLPQESPIN